MDAYLIIGGKDLKFVIESLRVLSGNKNPGMNFNCWTRHPVSSNTSFEITLST